MWDNMAIVILSKNKEQGMMTHHWEVLICILKANATWLERDTLILCGCLKSVSSDTNYLHQLLLKTSLQRTHGGSTCKSYDAEREWALERPASEIMCVGRETNALDCITLHMLLSYCHVFIAIPAYTIGQLAPLEFSHLTLSSCWDTELNQK